MKCPLLVKARLEAGSPLATNLTDCLKEECAWWDGRSQVCSVLMAQVNLSSIADSLDGIMNKMPHARQFVK